MIQQYLQQYMRCLTTERSVKPGQIAITACNETICSVGPRILQMVTQRIAERLDCAAVIAAEPSSPFPLLLLQRSLAVTETLYPHDSESRSFLHDIPLVKSRECQEECIDDICAVLSRRKGCIVEGIGIVSRGDVTVEQAYITWSSILHASFIKYFEDLLTLGPILSGEENIVKKQKYNWLKATGLIETGLQKRLPATIDACVREICRAGRLTVELGLVDSFFGNISCINNGNLYISQTAARLDTLEGQIDLIPSDGSATTGMTASSELPAHRAIYAAIGCKTVLHGHPRFPVIMSFFSEPATMIAPKMVAMIPVVSGEGGVGGLAEKLSTAFQRAGTSAVIVKGHGVFAIGRQGFEEAMQALIATDRNCKISYFQLLHERHNI